MADYHDHYHQWEALAEFNFHLTDNEEEFDEDNYLYCLCSRAYIRDGIKTYTVNEEDGSESDVEVLRDSRSQGWEDQSHVHFSLDTPDKVKCEKDEVASCYCSASHTDNCCSTDEHDPHHGTSHALQPSDSGADLTYQEGHSEYTNLDKREQIDQSFLSSTKENYLSEETFDKFWAINGERLIWASWIKTYSDYINPAFLDENNDLVLDDSNIPKQKSVDQVYRETEQKNEDDEIRERKFSYDSKINPYKKRQSLNQTEKLDKGESKDEAWLPSRRRSCSEHERIISPKTLPGTDSMTNVTKMTLSSYDVTSSHVTSDSSQTDDYSVTSSTSDDQSNDQTRITNIENAEQTSVDDIDSDQYWQILWKKHFGEQYAYHYANYIERRNTELPAINIEMASPKEEKIAPREVKNTQKVIDIECENSEGNSQELPTIIEVQAQVQDMKIQEPVAKQRKRGKKKSNKYLGSVGVLLQSLLKDQVVHNDSKAVEVTEAGEGSGDKKSDEPVAESSVTGTSKNSQPSTSNTNVMSYSCDDGDDEPPEEVPINLKRSHEIDNEDEMDYGYAINNEDEYYDEDGERIKATFETMGFSIENNKIPKGQMVYKKKLARLRPPRYKSTKKNDVPKKTYFEVETPVHVEQNEESPDDTSIPSDNEQFYCEFKAEAYRLLRLRAQEQSEGIKIINSGTVDFDQLKSNYLEQNKQNTEHMNIDPNDTDSNKDSVEMKHTGAEEIVEESGETEKSVVDIEVADNSINVTGKSKKLDNYDVQNAVESAASDENNALEASGVPLPDDLDQSSDDKTTDVQDNKVNQSVESVKRRRRQKRYAKLDEEELSSVPEELRDDPKMMKYWKKRHSLFHRFDEGIQLDRESWFSVTPENVARHIAHKFVYHTVLDAFCGAGGNTIQFATCSKKVIAIDIDPVKIEMARHNASVYGVSDRIQFIVGDFFELAPDLEADMVFLSPPWGGPDYSNNTQYNIETMLQPKPASELMSVARNISPTVTLYLPRNSRPDQILELAKEVGGSVEIEQSFLDKRFVAITAYYY